MVSVSVNGLFTAQWSPAVHDVAHRVAQRVLDGIGVPSTDVIEVGTITRVVRRLCTDAERSRVVEKYLKN